MTDILEAAAGTVPGLVVFCVFALALIAVVLRYLKERDKAHADVLREISTTCHDVSRGMVQAGTKMAEATAAQTEVLRDMKTTVANCAAAQIAAGLRLQSRSGPGS